MLDRWMAIIRAMHIILMTKSHHIHTQVYNTEQEHSHHYADDDVKSGNNKTKLKKIVNIEK